MNDFTVVYWYSWRLTKRSHSCLENKDGYYSTFTAWIQFKAGHQMVARRLLHEMRPLPKLLRMPRHPSKNVVYLNGLRQHLLRFWNRPNTKSIPHKFPANSVYSEDTYWCCRIPCWQEGCPNGIIKRFRNKPMGEVTFELFGILFTRSKFTCSINKIMTVFPMTRVIKVTECDDVAISDTESRKYD